MTREPQIVAFGLDGLWSCGRLELPSELADRAVAESALSMRAVG